MGTIVRYTDSKKPENRYPRLIISPTRPSQCCLSKMEDIGKKQREGSSRWKYKRCRRCGFAVRVVSRARDEILIANLRKRLLASFNKLRVDSD